MSGILRIGIACFAGYGGSGVVATELGRELARAGHKIHFISGQVPFRLLQGEFFENIYYHEVETLTYDALPAQFYGLAMSSKMTQIAIDEDLDLIHAHYAVPHAISGILAKQVLMPKDLRVVTTLHGTDITLVGRAPSFFPLTKWAIEHSDAVTTVSKWLRTETDREFGLTKPIQVIYNFVDTNRFTPGHSRCHREHFARPEEKIVLHVSNFRPVKRLHDVIAVFSIIARKMPAKLILIGDGPERERALELARSLDVMNRTYFLGRQTNIENYYAIADLFLFPSEYESFGVAALEALSSGVPVVATRGSGLSEVVEDGVTGFLAPVGDVEGLARSAMTILNDHELSAVMSEAGRRRATCCFRAETIRDHYLAVYRAVLEGRKP
ncbi:MAG: N-acetyl-alpha-D-glucosaminyl L-malate synthase BshA [bacterium]|nr:N-acetyl-alpha-D-glucosaminyl L-malate synthase BshA [Candidatus Sumerlaeota bacterium]